MTDAPGSLQSIRDEGGSMNRILIAVVGVVAFLSGEPATWAFTTQPITPDTMSNRLADPDQLPDKTSSGQSGGTTFGVPGGHMMLQFSAHRRAAPQTAHLLRARTRHSCRANIGRRTPGPGRRRKFLAGGPPAANRPRAAARSAQERQKPCEVSHGGMRCRWMD